MEIADLFEKVIANSHYAGNFEYDDLLQYMQSTGQNGMALAEEASNNFILIFVRGEPEGAAYIDEHGLLFGNRAVYLLDHTKVFRLFLVESEFVESLAARCKVYDKSHLRRRLGKNLPTLGGKKRMLGTLCIFVVRGDTTAAGVRVLLRKGRLVIGTDITGEDGRVCFKVLNDRYDIIVTDRARKVYKFMVEFTGQFSESQVDISGEGSDEQ